MSDDLTPEQRAILELAARVRVLEDEVRRLTAFADRQHRKQADEVLRLQRLLLDARRARRSS